jgi:hypothetical protein
MMGYSSRFAVTLQLCPRSFYSVSKNARNFIGPIEPVHEKELAASCEQDAVHINSTNTRSTVQSYKLTKFTAVVNY